MNITIENFIGVYENALPKEFCEKTIDYFHRLEEMGGVTNRKSMENVDKITKDDSLVFLDEDEGYSIHARLIATEFNGAFWSKCYANYAENFDILKKIDILYSYHIKAQCTKVGGGYHVWHYEAGAHNTSNRILAWTLYLNDVEEGGETEFLYYPKRIKPKAGTLVIFPAAFTHTHRGNPPISNTKYILTGWVEY